MYVGQTVRPFEERFAEHRRKKKSLLSRAFNKYGIDNFEYEIIDKAKTVDELNSKEDYWIKKLNTKFPSGYNLCYGGGNTRGYNHTEIARKRMSMAWKERGAPKGKKNPFYGKKHTEETKEHLRELWASGKREITPEWREKIEANRYTVKVRNITTGEVFDSIKEAADKHNVEATHITRVCKGKRKSCGGYKWEYVDQ